MRRISVAFVAIVVVCPVFAQQDNPSSRIGGGTTYVNETANLPVAKIGHDDLLGIMVYDSPELTRSVRVSPEGDIRLPMVKQRIHVSGLLPEQVESKIEEALVQENVLVDPIVTVSIIEFQSRPITVVGAVHTPVTFEETGTVTLLDAISRAQGLTDNAGSDILVSHQEIDAEGKPTTLTQRIPVRGLIDGTNTELNIQLKGGEEVRVPEAGRVYVLGNVKKPCSYLITDGSQSSVMKALSLSDGLDSFPASKAYIYRVEGSSSARTEIPIELKQMMHRKTPDVALMANDILYIPSASGVKAGVKALEMSVAIGTTLGSTALYVYK